MNRATLNLWVGIFVVAGFVAILFLTFKVGSISGANLGDSYKVTAHFDNIGGLKVKAPVKSSGVLVGRVSAIRFDTKKYDALVTMQLDRRIPFSTDTTASVLTSGILGEQYVGLDTGGESDNLKEGSEITHTQGALVLEKLIGQFFISKSQEAPDAGRK
ncbi:MAG: outer membrane lipid asymmetry maintenance protein MlaD [Pseudomonadota bacterium]|nr:outer membrane lipid asymmetry maintenance protein MlaD [Pseudomonadota bacterium]